MEINRKLSILLVLVAVSFAVTTVSVLPAWAATGKSKQASVKAKKRHLSYRARRIKKVNGSYIPQAQPRTVASAPATVCYGSWQQSLYGPVYTSWCQAATASSQGSGQAEGWAAPARSSGRQSGAAPPAGGYAPPPQQVNVISPPASVCYSGCVPYWTGQVYSSWCQPATAYNANSEQTTNWAVPAQTYRTQSYAAPQAGQPGTVCNVGSWLPCWW